MQKKQNKLKPVLLNVIKKIPLFLFCVLFISCYGMVCHSENSIVAIILLMGILLVIRSDFAINAGYVAISMPLLFCGIGLLAKASLFNPYLGIVINLLAILIIMLITGADKSKNCYLPFIMGYIMFQGYDVTGAIFTERMLSLLIGGVVIGGIYFLKNKNHTYENSPIKLLRTELRISEKRRGYIQLAVTVTMVTLISELIGFPKYMWINLTVLSLLNPISGDLKARKLSRIPATILGCIVFFILFELVIPTQSQSIVLMIAGFLSMFMSSYFIKTIYNSFSALASAIVIFPTTNAITIRVLANVIGVVAVILFTTAFNYIFHRIEKYISLRQQKATID